MFSSDKQIKDFIYLDTDRVRSFVAQIYEGVPEIFGETRSHERSGGGDAGINMPLLGKVGIEGSILYQKSSSETRSTHHYLYSLLEKKIKEFDKLRTINADFSIDKWEPDEFQDGTFVLIHGRIQIIDYRVVVGTFQMIPRIVELAASFTKQTLLQQLQEDKIDQKEYRRKLRASEVPGTSKREISQISEMVEKLYSGTLRVKAYPFDNDDKHYFVGNAAREYFPAELSNPTMSYGLFAASNWFVMGLVNRAVEYSSKSLSVQTIGKRQSLEDALEQAVFSLQEISKFTLSVEFPAISFVPIVVYRHC